MIPSLCVFGDSLAKGVVFDGVLDKYRMIKNCFVNTLESSLNVRIDNFAKFGCTIKKGRELIEHRLPSLGTYAYTALEFGGNDCDYDWAEVSALPNQDHDPKTPLAEFEAIYSAIIDRITAGGGHPVVFSLPPIDPERYFARISRGLSAENIRSWLGDIGHIYRWHELYNFTVCRLAVLRGIPLIDIRSAFLAKKDYRRYICQDGIHPSADGHALIADVIRKQAKELAPNYV